MSRKDAASVKRRYSIFSTEGGFVDDRTSGITYSKLQPEHVEFLSILAKHSVDFKGARLLFGHAKSRRAGSVGSTLSTFTKKYAPEAYDHAVVLARLMNLGGKLTAMQHEQVERVKSMISAIFKRRDEKEKQKFQTLFPLAFGVNPSTVSLSSLIAVFK